MTLRKIITLLSFLLALNFSSNARAEILSENSSTSASEKLSEFADNFMLKSAFTAEYQGANINSSGQNNQFKTERLGHQLKNFENIALGLNFRVHKYLGFNLNWSKSGLENNGLSGVSLSKKASLNIQNINATSLLYFPIVGDHWLDGFAEIGVSDVHGQLKFLETNGNQSEQNSHETAVLYGAGIQFMPYDLNIAFRFGFQKYLTNLGLLNAHITTFRGGVVIPF